MNGGIVTSQDALSNGLIPGCSAALFPGAAVGLARASPYGKDLPTLDAATRFVGLAGRRLMLRPTLLVLIALALASVSQAQTASMLGLSAQVVKGAGKLMICGGGPVPDDFRSEFIRLADGKKAKIVIIPTGMPFPNRQEMEDRFSSWREFPLESLAFIDTESRDEANQDQFVKPLDCATGVWISGRARSPG